MSTTPPFSVTLRMLTRRRKPGFRGRRSEMTENREGERILGTLRAAGDEGAVRMEDRFDTDVDDVWSALTDPGRLARWLGEFEGDLRPGGEFRAHFSATGWHGTGRVDAC